MPTADELAKFASRNQPADKGPIEQFIMEPLPPSILRAFPELAEWQKRENERRVEFVKKLNAVNNSTSS